MPLSPAESRKILLKDLNAEQRSAVVTAAIKESAALQQLQHEVAKEELQQAAKSERNDLFQKLIDADRNLAALLNNRELPAISLPSKGGGGKGGNAGTNEFEGKYSPTFLRFEEKFRENGVILPINRTRPVAARTDVGNGYLQRADNRGNLLIDPTVYARFGVRTQLHDGRLTLYLDPVEGAVKGGDVILLKVGLKDASMARPVEDQVRVRIVEEEKEIETTKGKQGKPKAGQKGSKEGDGDSAPTHGLPPYALLTKNGRLVGAQETRPWPEGFTEQDGGIIEDLGKDGLLYKINYDNASHIRYRLGARGDISRDVVTEKYILGMRILMLGYEHALRILKETKNGEANGIAEFQDEFRRMAARGAASTVLALAENLPKIVDRSAETSAQDIE
jgi:hypothetical protein